MIEAIRDAMDVKMTEDPDVLVFGEDVGYFGGVFRATAGLQEKHGLHRCFDTPISEGGIVGIAIGMAASGLRPVAEIQFADYIYPGYDQIASEAARLRYRSNGEFSAPLTIRTPVGGGIYGGTTHSQSPEALFTHIAGLKTVIPSNPYDAKGMLITAIEDNDPVLFLEPKRLYNGPFYGDPHSPSVSWAKHELGEVPEGYYTVPFESLDIDAISESVKKTGRCLILHEATRTSGFGAELSAQVAEACFFSLEAPIVRVTGWDTPYPHATEWAYFPGPKRVMNGIRKVMGES